MDFVLLDGQDGEVFGDLTCFQTLFLTVYFCDWNEINSAKDEDAEAQTGDVWSPQSNLNLYLYY